MEKEGAPSELKGLVPDLLKKIGPLINATFAINHVNDGLYGSKRRGYWDGMIGELVNKVSLSCFVRKVCRKEHCIMALL
jgi:hypothetical protein